MFWDYNNYFLTPIPTLFQLRGRDEITPVYPLKSLVSSPSLPLTRCWVKDEGVNLTGTHKDRSFRYWISYLSMSGIKEAVISSSGSSAFSAAYFCSLAGIKLTVFLRLGFPVEQKVELLRHKTVKVMESKTPKRDAVLLSRQKNIPNLRASADPYAIEGYKTLAFEIIKTHPKTEEIFVPTSSGTTLIGLYRGYCALQHDDFLIPKLFAVQTTTIHPIAEVFDKDFYEEKEHPARAIIDRISKRKEEALSILKKTGGGGYVISSEEVKKGGTYLKKTSVRQPGAESLLGLAAILKHRSKNPEMMPRNTLLVFTN